MQAIGFLAKQKFLLESAVSAQVITKQEALQHWRESAVIVGQNAVYRDARLAAMAPSGPPKRITLDAIPDAQAAHTWQVPVPTAEQLTTSNKSVRELVAAGAGEGPATMGYNGGKPIEDASKYGAAWAETSMARAHDFDGPAGGVREVYEQDFIQSPEGSIGGLSHGPPGRFTLPPVP